MTTTMRILGWQAEGLRCPDHEINCCRRDGKPFRTTLIQMPNGTGKTTTLTLLRAALSGVAKTWRPEFVTEFRKKDSTDDHGYFRLNLAINDKRVTILMQFDFEDGEVRYKTTKGSGQENGFDPPLEVRRFMHEQFVNFYVFDGELAENLLSRDHTHAERAVESLFQVHLLNLIKERLFDFWNENTKDVNATTSKGVTRRKNQLAKWIARRNQLVLEKSVLESESSSIQEDLDNQQQQHERELAKQHEQATKIEAAKSTIQGLKQQLVERSKGVLDKMRDPHAISPDFGESISQLKLGP